MCYFELKDASVVPIKASLVIKHQQKQLEYVILDLGV